MTDNPDLVARLTRFAENGRRAQASVIKAGALAPAPAPGYRFAVGDRVLELVDGQLATVRASYGAAATNAHVYELTRADGSHAVRLEDQIEPAPASVTPARP